MPAFQSCDHAIRLLFEDLFDTDPSICEWATSIDKLDLPGMSSLEGASVRVSLTKLGLESA